eukprot:TRINITY_DN4792_c0_g1_i3.p1 TRINITY_DN4792_c0_g1~~TRINITY_DN4792_c0_g1_i3.p1  ORF type:complete len:237 (+),score=22.77 TRINITY_DN4792_c0_g1_i3:126-836(+)
MSAGVVFYASLLVALSIYWLLSGIVPSMGTVIALLVAIVIMIASYFGYLPRTVTSFVARFLRFPRDSMMALGIIKRPFNYNIVDDVIIVGRLPRSLEDYMELAQKHQVRTVIDCTEDWEHLIPVNDVRSKTGLDIRRYATPDYGALTFDQLLEAVDTIFRSSQAGQRVYVHCNGGKGRAATVATAWLMRFNRLGAKTALKMLKSKRKITDLSKFGGMLPVWHLLRRYEQHLSSNRV